MTQEPVRGWKALLERAFDPARVEVSDDSHRHAGHLPPGSPSRGTHASVRVVSAQFRGLGLPERHRLIYAALGFGRGGNELHALAIRALTPEEDKAILNR